MNKQLVIPIITAILGLLIGYLVFGNSKSNHVEGESMQEIWTCSMHPQIRMNEPGDCPICGMDLIPLNNNTVQDNPMALKMSPTAMQLANVQTEIVSSGSAIKTIQLNGKVQADERHIFTQTTHVSGRIEQLVINYEGEQVKKGQVLAYIYSPELISAQKEVFEAQKLIDIQPALFSAAKEKLKNWKLSESTINQIVASGNIIERFPIRADVSGVVASQMVKLGDYVNQGSAMYKIANLNKLWILFDLYETDLSWVNKGDLVAYTMQAFPGQQFKGKISFIDPVINPTTRTAKARIELNNSKQKFKPEMFVNGEVKSNLSLAENTIVVPKSAVMWTGKRSIVYKKMETESGTSFMLQSVTLGPSLGASYVIKEGLKIGDEIAINGTFSIDAAAQLAGKPSMMNPEGGKMQTGHNHGGTATDTKENTSAQSSLSIEASNALGGLFDRYILLKDHLVKDEFEKSQKAMVEFEIQLNAINMSLFQGENHNVWMKHSSTLKKLTTKYKAAKSIDVARDVFILVSEQMIMITKALHPAMGKVYVQYCPMADRNNGARWLSKDKTVLNPYFGKSMLKCGEVKEEI